MAVLNKRTHGIPAGAVYIGRGSKWGNPFKMRSEADRVSVCAQYEQWLDEQLRNGGILISELAQLADKDLVCFCAPKQCHGHILEDRAKRAKRIVESGQYPEFKLIVAGGRDFDSYGRVSEEINHLANGELAERAVSIVSGMARGADRMAFQFAKENNVQVYEFPADWGTHGKAAGHIRNAEMAKFADGLLAFWDGKSRGTANMIQTMERMGKPVRVIRY